MATSTGAELSRETSIFSSTGQISLGDDYGSSTLPPFAEVGGYFTPLRCVPQGNLAVPTGGKFGRLIAGNQLRNLCVDNGDLKTDVPPTAYYLHFLNDSADG